MTGALIIIGSVIGGVGLVFVLVSLMQRAALRSLRAVMGPRVAARFPTGVVASDLTAMSFGLESRGKLQARGNGALVVTANEVCFLQCVPQREDVIPMTSITATSLTRTHLGKATPFKLIKLQFQGPSGPDSIAVMLRNPQAMLDTIETTRGRTSRLSS